MTNQKVEKLCKLKENFESKTAANYKSMESTIYTVLQETLGVDSPLTEQAEAIKSGWCVDGAIDLMYGQYDPTQYESNKYSAYLDLIKEAIQVVATYNIDTMNKAPTNIVIEKQYNNNQSGGNFQTGDNSTVSNTVPSDEKNWFSKEVVKTILAFISGVGATLLAQYLMRLFGWIK